MILQSKQGTGKDKFVELLRLLLGQEHYINTADTNLIFGKFNKLIENKILCVFNETQGKDTYEINEKIKDAITRDKLNMERKGHDPIVLNDALHYIFLSNNNNPIKVPPDDRRLFVIEVGEGNRNDEDFFSKIAEELKTKEYIKSFYDYFMSIDYNGYSFEANRPYSKNYELMRQTNVPVLARFLEYYVESLYKEVRDGEPLIYKDEINIMATPFFEKFKKFKTEQEEKIEMKQTKFGIDITRYDGITKDKTRLGTEYTIKPKILIELLKKDYKIEFYDYFNEDSNSN